MAIAHQAVLLDTSVLINLLRGRKEAIRLVRELSMSGAILATSSVNVAELYAGMRKGEERATEEFLRAFDCLPLTQEIARKAGEIVCDRRQIGRTHSLDDMMIAATAIVCRYSLLTDNRKDFEIPEINLFPA